MSLVVFPFLGVSLTVRYVPGAGSGCPEGHGMVAKQPIMITHSLNDFALQ